MSNFNPELTPKKWSAALWKWLREQLDELSSQITDNHKQAWSNKQSLDGVLKRVELLEGTTGNVLKKLDGIGDRVVEVEKSNLVVLDSAKANFDDIEALKGRVSNLYDLHDGDEVVLVFEQVGHQPVTRFHGSMTTKKAQSYVDRLGRPLYLASCLSPTLPEEEEE